MKIAKLTCLFLVVACACDHDTGRGTVLPDETSQHPQVRLQILDFDGIQRLIASHRGKIVVMDAWSTSCPPCMKEFPNLVALHEQYAGDRVACISLSSDYDGLGTPDDVKDQVLYFLQKRKATFDNVLSSLESDALLDKLGIYNVPAVFIYDRSGELVKRFDTNSGEFTYDDVREYLADLLQDGEMKRR